MMGRVSRRGFSSGLLTGVVAAFATMTAGRAWAHDGAHGNAMTGDRTDTAPQPVSTAGATEHQVEISNFDFQPAALQVRPGDTITWINRDIAPHTATASDNSWDTGTIRTDEAVTLEVTADMVPSYYCRFHPMMMAELEIEPAA